MSTSQQTIQLLEAVEGIRRRRARETNPTNLNWDKPIRTNFGNKLNRGAEYVQKGRLDLPSGTSLLPQNVEYGPYHRRVVYRNPLMTDEDGYLVQDDQDEDEMDEDYLEPIEDNPYKDVKVEEILRPLTTVSDLPTHPRMSKPYLEKGLPEMVKQTEEQLHVELKRLAAMKELFVRFRGDAAWTPVGEMETNVDELIKSTILDRTPLANSLDSLEPTIVNGTAKTAEDAQTNGVTEESSTQEDNTADSQLRMEAATNGSTSTLTNGHVSAIEGMELMQLDDPTDSNEPFKIHPIFEAPPPQHPELLSSLNPNIDPLIPLLSYIGKQEEVVRLVKELHSNLLKALRMRRDVFSWAKAEGHVGEMSDGEDWVDLEEWGLEPGDLVKGKEEDDNGDANGDATAGTRRGRRRANEGR